MTRKSRRLFSIVLALTAIVGAAFVLWRMMEQRDNSSRTGATSKATYLIGYQQTSLYRHLFVAKEKGFFEEEGVHVDLEPIQSGNRMLESLIAGRLDGAGLVNLQVGATADAKDPGRFKIVNFLVWDGEHYPDYILVPVDSAIRDLRDLSGKRLGTHPGSAVRAFASALLKQEGLGPDDVQLVELEPADMQSAFIAKAIDALYCMDPVATTLLVEQHGRPLLQNPMSEIFPPPIPISGTALGRRLIVDHPDDAARIVRALDRAILYLRQPAPQTEAAAFTAKYTQASVGLEERVKPPNYWTSTEIELPRVQALVDRFAELGVVPERVAVETFVSRGQ
jgi:ABC-type nitrate/sulfonate/bicarbonate transport system substrate-binding protein